MSGHTYGGGGYDPYGVAAGIPTSSVQSSPYLAWDPLSGSYVSYLIVDPGSGEMAAAGADANSYYSQSPWQPHPPPPGVEATVVGGKRSIGAVYHESVLGSHNSIAESTALFSSNPLAKHPKLDSASNLPMYPQRPGEKDCAFYMLTRTCKFGESCKFDHPVWVPEGGIPDWKEVPLVPSEMLPERPGAPDCPYFLKTEKCKFGLRCKFNHPKDNLENQCGDSDGSSKLADSSEYPERPSEPACAFYIRTGQCKYGKTCRFHHPKDHQVAVAEIEKGQIEPDVEKTVINVIPASMHNSKGLPMRPGESDCTFYLKTGSCKYGVICRYNHPDIKDIYPPAASLPQLYFCSVTGGALNVAGASMPHMDASPWSIQPAMGLTGAAGYPQRPGQPECDHYMKTGLCKFGPLCRFHHPVDRISSSAKAGQNDVTLTLAGFPRREGGPTCAFYMKTGMCKYGSSCVYDHPPPGEAVAKAVATMQDPEAPEDEGNVSKDTISNKDE